MMTKRRQPFGEQKRKKKRKEGKEQEKERISTRLIPSLESSMPASSYKKTKTSENWWLRGCSPKQAMPLLIFSLWTTNNDMRYGMSTVFATVDRKTCIDIDMDRCGCIEELQEHPLTFGDTNLYLHKSVVSADNVCSKSNPGLIFASFAHAKLF
ncbi:hypothetical protein VTN77DRAFT_9459 [Rasamsonia byssochlamydoides]|uniref:uncharacterized protein n=1 Tax=Rasamsonia byssochlamydoides TaxID=89139 RepID=UPI003743345A